MPKIIQTDRLTKLYGKVVGIIDLDLEVEQGEVFGFLGPNAAGKTTTIRILFDLIRATRGSATVFGLDVHRDSPRIRERCGYVPSNLALYEDMSGDDYLTYFRNLRPGIDMAYFDALVQRLQIDLSRQIKGLSHGNRQKIGLVQAFMHRPDLIILDEPTIGLDPLMQQEFYNLLRETRSDGRTVFLSSHNLPEVEKVCNRAGIIRDGRLTKVEEVAALKKKALRSVEVEFEGEPPPMEILAGLQEVSELRLEDHTLHFKVMGKIDPVVKVLARYEVVNFTSREPNLEEVFMAYYGGD